MKSAIYMIENTVNGHMYVGSTTDICRRKSQHWTMLRRGVHTNPHLQAAYNLYGDSSFVFKIAMWCREEHLLWAEQFIFDLVDIKANGYNQVFTPERPKWTEEMKKAQSLRCKGVPKGPMSEEHKKAQSDRLKGKPKSKEHNAKVSSALMGHKVSSETRLRISVEVKKAHDAGGWIPSEAVVSAARAMKGTKKSEETKRKMSEAQLGRINSPETKQRISDSLRRHYATQIKPEPTICPMCRTLKQKNCCNIALAREIRMHSTVSLEVIASKFGVSRGTIYLWCKGIEPPQECRNAAWRTATTKET